MDTFNTLTHGNIVLEYMTNSKTHKNKLCLVEKEQIFKKRLLYFKWLGVIYFVVSFITSQDGLGF